jgi:hypothetical protein
VVPLLLPLLLLRETAMMLPEAVAAVVAGVRIWVLGQKGVGFVGVGVGVYVSL